MQNPENNLEDENGEHNTQGSAMWKNSEALFNELRIDKQKAINVFSNQEKFSKLTTDQISLLIYTHGVELLQAVYSIDAITSKVNIANIVGAAEENRDLSLFILNNAELCSLCDSDDFVRMVEVAKEILARDDILLKLSADQRSKIEKTAGFMYGMNFRRLE